MTFSEKTIPELLSPAGSREALEAAIAGGADAVYFGGTGFSNRMRAKNFSGDELRDAIALCHSYGVRCYLTVNTRVRDIELREVLDFCASLAEWGADGLIVADLGIAAGVVKELFPRYPRLELHASTQMSQATAADGRVLKTLGFSRMVVPRELSERELRKITAESPVEIEMFVHGAHCVSYSGQCLMSWAMGGRSGNRGECAQPCRMMYTAAKVGGPVVKSRYPLSLRDMCLAAHIPEIIDAGVASLKIEGRQKSPAYVYGVTSIYRRLLDEGRGATSEEIRMLDALFSRDGFTDGYFRENYRKMLGVRPEDAASVPSEEKYDLSSRRRPLTAVFTLRRDLPARLELRCGQASASVEGDIPTPATGAPVTEASAGKNLTKFGGTAYILAPADVEYQLDEGLYYPVSGLNALRRACLERLEAELAVPVEESTPRNVVLPVPETSVVIGEKTAEVRSAEQLTPLAMSYFDRIYVHSTQFSVAVSRFAVGAELCALLPAVACRDEETAEILKELKSKGCRRVMIHTMGQLAMARSMGFVVDGSFRLNLTNSEALSLWRGLGLSSAVVSPELKLPAIRDLIEPCGVTVYGRIPLMLTQRCFVSDGGCGERGRTPLCRGTISDRKGEVFPVISDGTCRSVIYNSRKLWMADRMKDIRNMASAHFMFTDETASEVDAVVRGYQTGAAGEKGCKRL